MPCLLFVFLIMGTEPAIDYSVTAEYFEHSAVIQKKWQVTLVRQGTRTSIAVKNFEGKTFIRSIPHDEYAALIEKLTQYGVWSAPSFRPPSSKNSFYRVTVREPAHEHSFELEADVALAGRNLRSMDMIHAIIGAAHRAGQD